MKDEEDEKGRPGARQAAPLAAVKAA